MEQNNLNTCEENCNNKCYIKLKDDILVQKLCTKALRRIFSNCVKIVEQEVKKHNMTMEDFFKSRDKKVTFDDKGNPDAESKAIMEVRKAIEIPDENDIFQKTMTKIDFDKFVKQTGFILGFVALEKHLSSKTSIDYIQDLALPGKFFKSNHSVIIVRFILDNPMDLENKLIIPFDDPKEKIYDKPCTGSGFPASKNNNISPEYRLVKQALVGLGSQTFRLHPNGKEELIEVYDYDSRKFATYDGTTIVKIDNEYFEKDKDGNIKRTEIDESTTEIIDFV